MAYIILVSEVYLDCVELDARCDGVEPPVCGCVSWGGLDVGLGVCAYLLDDLQMETVESTMRWLVRIHGALELPRAEQLMEMRGLRELLRELAGYVGFQKHPTI